MFEVVGTKVINVRVSAVEEATFICTLAQRVRKADQTKVYQIGVTKGPKDSRPKVQTRSIEKHEISNLPTKPTSP